MKQKEINQAIIETINIIVDKKIADAGIPKIIRATIDSVVDTNRASKKYLVKYQDGTFFTYSLLPLVFKKNADVYILLTEGVVNKGQSFIIGSTASDVFEE